MNAVPALSTTRAWCTFRLAGGLYGLDASAVQEVLNEAALTPVPLAPAAVRGLIHLRGHIVTALDLRRVLDLGDDGAPARPAHVVVEALGSTFTLLVDAIGDVVPHERAALEPAPDTLRGPARARVAGVAPLERELLVVLDLERVIEGALA